MRTAEMIEDIRPVRTADVVVVCFDGTMYDISYAYKRPGIAVIEVSSLNEIDPSGTGEDDFV